MAPAAASCRISSCFFLPRDAMLAWCMLSSCVCPSIRPFCLSQVGVLPKRLTVQDRDNGRLIGTRMRCRMAPFSMTQAGIVRKRLNRSSSFLAQRLPSAYPTLRWKGIELSPKLRALPSGTLTQSLDLENFATARRSHRVLST